MADLRTIATDTSAIEEGKWVTYLDTDLELKIASLKSPAYESSARTFLRNKRKSLSKTKLRNMTEYENMILLLPLIVQHILLDWKNLFDGEEEIKFSPDKARELLADRQFRDLYEFILQTANDGAEFMLEEDEDDLGNSETTLTGGSSGETPND